MPGVQIDPFVEMSVRANRIIRSKTIWNDENPEWNEEMDFVIQDPQKKEIKLIVKDQDDFNDEVSCSSCPSPPALLHGLALTAVKVAEGFGLNMHPAALEAVESVLEIILLHWTKKQGCFGVWQSWGLD